MKCVTNQLEGEIYDIISNKQKPFKKEFSIRWIKFEAWWETLITQAVQETIEQHVMNLRYPKMNLVSDILESIRRMDSSNYFTADISEWLHIANIQGAYQSSNKVNYIQLIIKHNDQCTRLDYIEETLSYLALQGWYDIDSAKIFNILPTTDKQQSSWGADPFHLQTIQNEALIWCLSQWVYLLRGCLSHVSIKHLLT